MVLNPGPGSEMSGFENFKPGVGFLVLNPGPGSEMSGFENFKPGVGFFVHAVRVLPGSDWPGPGRVRSGPGGFFCYL